MNNKYWWVIVVASTFVWFSCESEKRIPPKGYIPVESIATSALEASYFWIPQDKLNSGYWKEAPYISVPLEDKITKQTPSEGYLNTTGTYNGTSSFNRGRNPELTVKAGYDDYYIYILVEWNDTTTNASLYSRLFNGPDDNRKADSALGWTSQKNNDNITLLFDVDNGNKDAWYWSMAFTAPFDAAFNATADANGDISNMELSVMRNGADSSRAAPALEWNGEPQKIVIAGDKEVLLDPAYYLLDGFTISYTGNVEKGEYYFNEAADCKFCHGMNGNGIVAEGFTSAGNLNDPFTSRYSREGLAAYIGSPGHEGGGALYFGKIENDADKVNDLIAFMRGIAGVPGYIMDVPEDEPDIIALSNVGFGSINNKNSRYQVLFRRKLVNNQSGDVQFDPNNSYSFQIRVADNDNLNFIGSGTLDMIFKSSEL